MGELGELEAEIIKEIDMLKESDMPDKWEQILKLLRELGSMVLDNRSKDSELIL
ncbi:MAG: hypothetical protein ACOY46_16070 [Bacillota bacterium]